MQTNPTQAPSKVVWATSPELRIEELPCVGLHSDSYYRPMQIGTEWLDYHGAVMTIDPSGRGKDETAYAVVKMCNGNLYLTDSGGLIGGYTDKTLQSLADTAKKENVKLIENATKDDQESVGLSFSYTMGSMTIVGNSQTEDNSGGSQGTDDSVTELSVAFAF